MQIHPIAQEFISNGGFPVKHLSYSSMKKYLSDPRGFLKSYIRYEFDNTTSPSYMAGLALHKALEIYFAEIIATGEIISLDTVKKHALDHITRIMNEKAGKAFSLEIEKYGHTFAFPNFAKDLKDEEILKLREDAEAKLRELYISGELEDEKGYKIQLDGDPLDAIMIELANSLIKWGASSLEEVQKWAIQAVENYFADEPSYGKPVVTERFETVIIQDDEGEDMPIPVKVGVDRIDLVEDGKYCDIIDYKSIDKFSIDDTEKLEYELQGAANYFAAMVITGVVPRRMIYVEVLKSHPGYEYAADPTNPLLKADLIAIAEKHGVEFAPKELVADMKTKLVDAGVFTKKPGVNTYVIDFQERPDIISFFLALYKGIVTMIAVSEMFGVYLPNLFERFGGLESGRDFKEFEAIPKPITIKKLETVSVPLIEAAPEVPVLASVTEEIDTF